MSNPVPLSMMAVIAVCAGCGGAAATSTESAAEPETTPPTIAATEGSAAAAEPDGEPESETGAAADKGSAEQPPGTVVLWCREESDHTHDCAPPDEGLLQAKPLLSVVQHNESALQDCAGGKSDAPVRVHIHIDGEGAVSAVETPGSELDAETRGCLEEAVRGWSFPAPETGEVVIEYPLEPAPAATAD